MQTRDVVIKLGAAFVAFLRRCTKLQLLGSAATLLIGYRAMFRLFSARLARLSVAAVTYLVLRRILARGRSLVSVSGKSVLVTGCDHGFGEGVMRKLQECGFRVFAGCLSQEKVAEYSREFSPARVVPLLFDVTRADHAEEVRKRVEQECGPTGLFGLVNNAGVLTLAPVDWLDMKDFRFNMEVNFFGAVSTTKTLLPLLVRGGGRVIQLASVAGHLTAPNFAAYAASKHALEAFSDACRAEFWDLGVTVVRIEPGIMSTSMASDFLRSLDRVWAALPSNKQAAYGDLYKAAARNELTELLAGGEDPRIVVDTVVEALTVCDPKAAYRIGTSAELLIWASRFQFLLDFVFSGCHPLANLELF